MGQTLVIDLGDTFATLSFAADGNLDLSMENVSLLRDALKQMRRAPARPRPSTPRPPSRKKKQESKGEKPQEHDDGEPGRPIRVWAKANGYDIGDYGRIPGEVRDAYENREHRLTPLTVANGQYRSE